MAITAATVSRVFAAAQGVMPSLAANLAVPPKVGDGAAWSGSGTAIPLRGTAAILFDGTQIRDGLQVFVEASAFEAWVPEPDRIMRVQIGNANPVDYVIRERTVVDELYCMFVLEKQYA
jgi:hypothetical protein